jgi:hypothetical protein
VPGVKHEMEGVNMAVVLFTTRQLERYWREHRKQQGVEGAGDALNVN